MCTCTDGLSIVTTKSFQLVWNLVLIATSSITVVLVACWPEKMVYPCTPGVIR